MRAFRPQILAVAIIAAGCTATSSTSTPSSTAPEAATPATIASSTTAPASPTATTLEPTTTEPASPEVAIAYRYVDATLSGDVDAWTALVSPDATFRSDDQFIPLWEELSEYPGALTPDFNGDGLQTLGDQLLRDVALNAAYQTEPIAVACRGATTRVECSVAASDVFFRAAGIDPEPSTLHLTIAGDVVEEIQTPAADPTAGAELAWLGRDAGFLEYETWVFANHGEAYRALFETTGPIFSRDTVPVHAELIREWSDGRVNPNTVPADDRAIVYQRSTDLGPSLWRAQVDGSGLAPLPIVGLQPRDPAWSPDRTMIAFDRSDTGRSGWILIAAADGSNVRELAAGRDPDWSPDGQTVVFTVAGERGDGDLHTIDIDTGEVVRLTDSPDRNEQDPEFAPDGTALVFVAESEEPAATACIVLDLASGATTVVSPPRTSGCTWAPGGESIAFHQFDDIGTTDIWVVGLDGSAPIRLTDGPGIDVAPSYAPDGSAIVFSSDRSNPDRLLDLWIMDADGSDPRQFTLSETVDIFADWG